MQNKLLDGLKELFEKEPDNKAIYQIGQRVKVNNIVLYTNPVPAHWVGVLLEVVSMRPAGFTKCWYYQLKHPNGQIETFEEYEINRRFKKLNKKTNAT